MHKVKNIVIFTIIGCFLTLNTAVSGGVDSGTIPLDTRSDLMQADIKSERIPAGTALAVRMETPVNSLNYFEGDSFRSTLIDDIRIGSQIVLPAGTLLRGKVDYVKPAGHFRKGGELKLSFDHAVTPFGRQIPVSVETTRAKKLTSREVFSAGGGYTNALSNNFDKSAEILTSTTDYLYDWGRSFWKGIPVVFTAPAGAIVGAFGGAGYFTGKSIYDMFKKGEEIKINPGDIIEVTLVEPVDVPTN